MEMFSVVQTCVLLLAIVDVTIQFEVAGHVYFEGKNSTQNLKIEIEDARRNQRKYKVCGFIISII